MSIARAGAPDAALANHLVTAPLIMERAGVPFAVKVHGSDLSYTVIPELERFGPMARDGARAARGILVGSDHIAERLREAVDEPEVNAKVRLGPPGVDTGLFEAIAREDGPQRLRDLADELESGKDTQADGESSWDRDPAEAAAAVRWLAETEGPRVVFVGKLIVSKGIDLLVAAWPLVHARFPDARLILCGFGAYREGVENLITALGQGDIEGARGIAHRGRALEGGEMKPLEMLARFLADPPPNYAEFATNAAGSIALSGRLEHSEVGRLVPACDALVFPSTHPEAFGMVAAEAASAGVFRCPPRTRVRLRSAGRSWTVSLTRRRVSSRSALTTRRSSRSPPGSTSGWAWIRTSAAAPGWASATRRSACGGGRRSRAR